MRQVEINTDGEVVAWASCDDCGREDHPDALIRCEQLSGADYYRCDDCNTRRGEQRDGALWAQVDLSRMADND